MASSTAIQVFAHYSSEEEVNKAENKEDPTKEAKTLFGCSTINIQTVFREQLSKDTILMGSGDSKITRTAEELSKNYFAQTIAHFYAQNLQKVTLTTTITKDDRGKEADEADQTGERKEGDNTDKPLCSIFLNQTACGSEKNSKWED